MQLSRVLALAPLVALAGCSVGADDAEPASTDESALVKDIECSPHPWASDGSCNGSFRSSYEGPRTTPKLAYTTESVGGVLAAKDGSLLFARRVRVRGESLWYRSYVETRLAPGATTPQDYPDRKRGCRQHPNGQWDCGRGPLQALDPDGNIVQLVSTLSGTSAVWALKILSATDKQEIKSVALPAKVSRNGYATELHPLKGGLFAVNAETDLFIVSPATGSVVTCDDCTFAGTYGNDVLVTRPDKSVSWWTPSTNTFKALPLPPTVYPADRWRALGALADGTAVIFRAAQTIDTVPDELALIQRDGTLRAKVPFHAWDGAVPITPLTSGDFIYSYSDTRISSQGVDLGRIASETNGLNHTRIIYPAVDAKDVIYVVGSYYDATGFRRRGRRLTAITGSGAPLWTYEGPGLGNDGEDYCKVGIATDHRLFVQCGSSVSVFTE